MIPAWFARMNQRERMLALGIAGIIFLLVNLVLWSALFRLSAKARSDWATRRSARTQQEAYLKEYDTWQRREEWLKKNQPVLKNPADASILLDQVKQIASKYNVQIENPQIGPVETTEKYQSLSGTIETKSAWEPLVHLLYDLQKPESFVVCENVNLLVDGTDPTVMRGRFKIAKWYAPAGRK